MDMNDILTLAKAGFTAQQIAALGAIQPLPEPAPAPVPEPAPAPVPEPAPAPAPDPVLAELQKLTGLMQMGNILGTNQPKQQTPEEILAEIINPPIKNKKE